MLFFFKNVVDKSSYANEPGNQTVSKNHPEMLSMLLWFLLKLFLFVLFVFFLIWLIKYHEANKYFYNIPGPIPFPIIGSVYLVRSTKGNI